MLQLNPRKGISYYCKLFGKSRQAYYEQNRPCADVGLQETIVLNLVREIRKDLPRCGTDKLYYMLKDTIKAHGVKMGRDRLYELLGNHGLLIRHRRRRPYTTDSNHRYKKYPNLIRGKVISEAGSLWVSDITYIRLTNKFCYLSIITDAYSHKIVGYKLHPTLESAGPIDALMMAGKDPKRKKDLIHHSDRGTQYCCNDYVSMIQSMGIQLSMTEGGDPYENPIAERVNGILKYEHGLIATFSSIEKAHLAVDDAIHKYNEVRLHDSCGRLTPKAAHDLKGVLEKRWRNKKYSTNDCVEYQQE